MFNFVTFFHEVTKKKRFQTLLNILKLYFQNLGNTTLKFSKTKMVVKNLQILKILVWYIFKINWIFHSFQCFEI